MLILNYVIIRMGMKIEFEYTWCDYLTPCPYGRDCFVGDFDCSICPHFVALTKTSNVKDKIGDYGKYCKVYVGQIFCKYKKVE